MGRGNYSEHDVKEAARAFTGWGASLRGEFVFRKFQHDDGDKVILGHRGNFDGDEVLDILLEQKQTAYFITKKIYRYLVNDIVDESHISKLADRFYDSHYDIKGLLEDIFTSEWFYDKKNIGAIIKSPVVLITGIRRTLPMEIENEEVQLLLQRLLGQLLFYPPNVAGWPGGMNWIDSSTLMFRLRIPQIIYSADEFQMKPKDDDDQMMGMKDSQENAARKYFKTGNGQFIKAKIHWDAYLKKFDKISREDLSSAIALSLLQIPSSVDQSTLDKYTDASSRESFIKTTAIQLMSTPEYQLC